LGVNVPDSSLNFCWKYDNKQPRILSVPNVELINEIGVLDAACLWVSVIDNDFACATNDCGSGRSCCLAYLGQFFKVMDYKQALTLNDFHFRRQ